MKTPCGAVRREQGSCPGGPDKAVQRRGAEECSRYGYVVVK